MARSSSSFAPIHAIALLAVAVAALIHFGGQYLQKPIVPKEVQVFFSPKGGCAEAVVNELRHAQRSVLVQAYSFTNRQIAQALVEAHKRGLDVEIILDKSIFTEHYSEGDFTAHAGIPTFVDARHPIAHNKVMIIDGETVITGSFNFTKQAEESNAENLLIIHKTPALAEEYANNWRMHQQHSEPYKGR